MSKYFFKYIVCGVILVLVLCLSVSSIPFASAEEIVPRIDVTIDNVYNWSNLYELTGGGPSDPTDPYAAGMRSITPTFTVETEHSIYGTITLPANSWGIINNCSGTWWGGAPSVILPASYLFKLPTPNDASTTYKNTKYFLAIWENAGPQPAMEEAIYIYLGTECKYANSISTYYSTADIEYRTTLVYFNSWDISSVTASGWVTEQNSSYTTNLLTNSIGLYKDYKTDINEQFWYNTGLEEGKEQGYSDGYEKGLFDGSAGSGVGSTIDTASTVLKIVWQIVDIPIFGPYFTLGTLLSIAVVLSIVIFVLKFIRG